MLISFYLLESQGPELIKFQKINCKHVRIRMIIPIPDNLTKACKITFKVVLT